MGERYEKLRTLIGAILSSRFDTEAPSFFREMARDKEVELTDEFGEDVASAIHATVDMMEDAFPSILRPCPICGKAVKDRARPPSKEPEKKEPMIDLDGLLNPKEKEE